MLRRVIVIVLGLLFLTLAIAVVYSSTCGDKEAEVGDNPHDVAYAAIEALGSGDVDNVCQYFTGEAYHLMRSGLLDFYAMYSDIETEEIYVTITDEGDSIATALIDYDLTYGYGEYQDSQHINRKVQLIRQQGQWYLNGKI